MGGDHAPGPELDAAAAIVREQRRDASIILVGDEPELRAGLAKRQVPESSLLRIRHASQIVKMDDPPAAPVRGKKDSSMRVCFDLVKAGEAEAVVSAGHSGAMVACGLFVLKRLPGASRPAIVTSFPALKGSVVLCDMGANVDVQPPLLAQFGILGAVFSHVTQGVGRPRLGLLSNGTEEGKGTDLTRGAHAILQGYAAGGAPFEYLGYVEGRDIFTGDLDVVATDGFTGNVVLKTTEGAVAAMTTFLKNAFKSSNRAQLAAVLAGPALRSFKQRVDYAETGGAPLLGVDGLALVCHGSSHGAALKNAVHAAARFADRGLVARVAEALKQFPVEPEETGPVRRQKAI
jgi:glycerol-3-phosphate acyltransferase PlsX